MNQIDALGSNHDTKHVFSKRNPTLNLKWKFLMLQEENLEPI